MEFNSLPVEVHLEIFSFLSVSDVMRIRLVCKQWAVLINYEFKFKRLRCFQLITKEERFAGYDFCFVAIRSFLDYACTDLKFSRVKYLYADLIPNLAELKDAFDFLNSFKSLEETEIICFLDDSISEEVEKKRFVVSLNRLKKARFDFDFDLNSTDPASVVLDLPSLLYLELESLAVISIKHPQKLRSLKTNGLFRGALDYSQFTSLAHIYTNWSDLPSISASFIERLPSLRELHLGSDYYCKEEHRPTESPRYGKATPRIFYFGFEVSISQINLEAEQWPNSFSFFPPEDSTRFVIRNRHSSVDQNRHVSSIHYNLMASELDDCEMFGVMFRKFSNIRSLQISGNVVDANRLLKFIGQFRVSTFRLERTSLPQWFFEKLPESFPFIRYLEFTTEPTMSILSGDFDFIFKLKNLNSLYFKDCPLPLNFVARVLKELKREAYIQFQQPANYEFGLSVIGSSKLIKLKVAGFGFLHFSLPVEESPEFVNVLNSRLEADDGFMCAKELMILLRHLKIEEQNRWFMMRKYIYDHTHSICLSEEQMRLLNLIC